MQDLIKELAALLTDKNMTLATAESCTGGLLAATVTHRPGASKMFECGFVTYSNQSKTALLDIPDSILRTHGAVSSEAAMAMANGAILKTTADMAIAVTGVAGPEGGTDEKPVGLVFFGFAIREKMLKSVEQKFSGERADIRRRAVQFALQQAIALLKEKQ